MCAQGCSAEPPLGTFCSPLQSGLVCGAGGWPVGPLREATHTSVVISGLTFTQNVVNMVFFVPFLASFGKRSAGSLRRGCECIVLEPSEMIVVSPSFRPSPGSQQEVKASSRARFRWLFYVTFTANQTLARRRRCREPIFPISEAPESGGGGSSVCWTEASEAGTARFSHRRFCGRRVAAEKTFSVFHPENGAQEDFLWTRPEFRRPIPPFGLPLPFLPVPGTVCPSASARSLKQEAPPPRRLACLFHGQETPLR